MTQRQEIEDKLYQIFGEDYVSLHENGGGIIHFPDIDIRNTNGTERNIKDLYVSLGWEYNGAHNINSFSTTLEGCRLTFTPEDIYNRYSHSHLESLIFNTDNDEDEKEEETCFIEFTNFCIGDDTLYHTLADLSLEFTIDKFIILLNTIDDFVRWESLEGGPYMLIGDMQKGDQDYQQVTSSSRISNSNGLLESFYKNISDDLISEFTFISDTTDTSIKVSEKVIEKWEHFAVSNYKLGLSSFVIKYKGNYYQKNHNYKEMLDKANNLIWDGYIRFKEEIRYPKIVFPETTSKNMDIKNKGVRAPHPAILPTIIKTLNTDLHNYITKQDTWELVK